jgi:hypothetical protein
MKTNEVTKVEFLLTLNENIIVQRFLNIKNINVDAKDSYELYDFVRYFSEYLTHYLKTKSIAYLTDNKEMILQDPTIMETSSTSEAEVFNIYIKIGNQTVSHRIIDGKVYPPKVRYTVDVRSFIKDFLKELTDILSSNDLTHSYLEKDLLSNQL